MGANRGTGLIATLERLFKTIHGVWVLKHDDGYLTVFAWCKTVPNRIVICVDFIMPAWTKPTNTPTTLFNHVSFYMKDVGSKIEDDGTWINTVTDKKAQELDSGLWASFQNEFRDLGYRDMVFGANEHRLPNTEWYYRPTKFWNSDEILDVFHGVVHLLALMCKMV